MSSRTLLSDHVSMEVVDASDSSFVLSTGFENYGAKLKKKIEFAEGITESNA